MFQNITENDELEENEEIQKTNIFGKLKTMFKIQDIVLYAISFMISIVSFGGEFMPFGIAIFGATCSNMIPAGIVFLMTAIGTTIGFGFKGLLLYLATAVVFIAMILIFRPEIYDESRNEKKKLGKFIFLSTAFIQILKMLFSMFLWYDLISAIMSGIIAYIFYKIFSNSIIVIKSYSNKKAFSIEEVMGTSLMMAVAFYALNGLHIFNLSIGNILSIMLVMFLGWQYGMLVGATGGITIGMVLSIIGSQNPMLIAAYAISGMLAGILNKLGKVGVIIGFLLGNAILTYIIKGSNIPVITIREILIASLVLLVTPKSVKIDIENIIGKAKYLPAPINNRLDGEKEETILKLNSVSETISEMAQSYNQVATETIKEDEEFREESKQIFKEELLNNIEDFSENMLYEDIIDSNEVVFNSIFDLLEEQDTISPEELIKILEDNNNYVIEIENQENKEEVEQDIKQIVKAINYTYRINKLNLIWKQKEASNKKVLANQLGGVSKVISSIADEIEEKDSEKKEEKAKYKITIGTSKITKNNSTISGDSSIDTKLNDGKYMLAISDGMGSGEKAHKSSSTVIKMLDKLLTTGFNKEDSIGLINSAVNLNSENETYATIDISIIDLINGHIEFIKNGACPTFIKRMNSVEIIKSVSLPAGIVDELDLVVYDKELIGEEIIVMCSDGILESNEELVNKELWVKDLLEKTSTTDVQKIANILIQESIDNGYGVAKDDMTVLVAKIDKM